MRMFPIKISRSLIAVLSALGLAVFIFLLPSKITSPLRTLFTQSMAPVQGRAFDVAGDTLTATGTLRDAFFSLDSQKGLQVELQHLHHTVQSAREKVDECRQKIKSYEQLNVKSGNLQAISARVSSYDTISARNSITIDAGGNSGVRKGMAVTSLGSLIGKVAATGPWASRVKLVTDPDSTLSCRVQRTRDLYLLKGNGGGECAVEWVDRQASVETGDILVTFPLTADHKDNNMIPPGLPVARVTNVAEDDLKPLFKRITAAPLVNVTRLEYVEVLAPDR